MWRRLDLVLRFLYVALAPAMLAPLAVSFPITGVLVSGGLAMAVALFGTARWRELTARVPIVGGVIGGMAAVGEFYREHPPRPLVYYIFYPLLAPYWLIQRTARREFLLYRKMNALAIGVLVVGGAWSYLHDWRPELTFRQFIVVRGVTLVLQLLATFALVMPIVTTMLMLREQSRRRTLWALASTALLSGLCGVAVASFMHEMQMDTSMRLVMRASVSKDRASIAVAAALDAAWDAPTDQRLDRARERLRDYFKPDEADAWNLYDAGGLLVLYVPVGNGTLMWLARTSEQRINRPDALPAEVRKLLGLAR